MDRAQETTTLLPVSRPANHGHSLPFWSGGQSCAAETYGYSMVWLAP